MILYIVMNVLDLGRIVEGQELHIVGNQLSFRVTPTRVTRRTNMIPPLFTIEGNLPNRAPRQGVGTLGEASVRVQPDANRSRVEITADFVYYRADGLGLWTESVPCTDLFFTE